MSALPAARTVVLNLLTTATNSDSEPRPSSSYAASDELDIISLLSAVLGNSGEGTLLAYAVPGMIDLPGGICVAFPMTLGKKRTRPARIAGIQAQNIAVVVSRVDQNVVGILSHVGSAVRPNVRRLYSLTMDVMHTLDKGVISTTSRWGDKIPLQSSYAEHCVHSDLLLYV